MRHATACRANRKIPYIPFLLYRDVRFRLLFLLFEKWISSLFKSRRAITTSTVIEASQLPLGRRFVPIDGIVSIKSLRFQHRSCQDASGPYSTAGLGWRINTQSWYKCCCRRLQLNGVIVACIDFYPHMLGLQISYTKFPRPLQQKVQGPAEPWSLPSN